MISRSPFRRCSSFSKLGIDLTACRTRPDKLSISSTRAFIRGRIRRCRLCLCTRFRLRLLEFRALLRLRSRRLCLCDLLRPGGRFCFLLWLCDHLLHRLGFLFRLNARLDCLFARCFCLTTCLGRFLCILRLLRLYGLTACLLSLTTRLNRFSARFLCLTFCLGFRLSLGFCYAS